MSLDRSMGHGILEVELICDGCSECIDLEYVYMEHCWRGTCWQCRMAYVIDLEVAIYQAQSEMYCDWDLELKELEI